MVFVQKWPFFQIFFQAIQTSKMSFTIFQIEKTPFQAIKTRSSKSRKIDIFPKGLTHGVGPKMAIFPTVFFQAIQATKMSFAIFQNEKTSFQGIKTRSSNSRKMDIFPSNPLYFSSFVTEKQALQTIKTLIRKIRKMVFLKKCNLPHSSFLFKILQIKVRNDVLHS